MLHAHVDTKSLSFELHHMLKDSLLVIHKFAIKFKTIIQLKREQIRKKNCWLLHIETGNSNVIWQTS